ncbi:MAG: OadG family protein [Lachnospiraceae bacterium]|nr:OadG family protein [Lachnospiraceae bacterium]
MNGLLFAAKVNIGTALANTVMGITIVFCMLLLISFIISLLKFVNKIGAKKPEPAPAAPVVDTDGDGEDDLELVAVITAAIYEYERAMGNDVAEGGLVVRSIRKINKSKWQNA